MVTGLLIFCVAVFLLGAGLAAAAGAKNPEPRPEVASPPVAADKAAKFTGMDEAVNERLSTAAGLPAREPFINLEQWGDVWNAALLLAGAI